MWRLVLIAVTMLVLATGGIYAVHLAGADRPNTVDRNVPGATTGVGKNSLKD
jgi:hypothetical protein